MNGLKTARALIIDDKSDEAMPIIQALSRVGIGAIYLSGDKREDLPEKPLEGIRLVFVDMDLNTSGGGVEEVVGKTVTVLSNVLAPDTAPCFIIAWTKHTDYSTRFSELLAEQLPLVRPGFVTSMEKPQEIDIGNLVDRIQSILQGLWPIDVLLSWEQLAHNAATGTTDTISTVVASETLKSNGVHSIPGWQKGIKSVLAELVRAGGGSTVKEETAIGTLMESLNAIHLDHLEVGVQKSYESNGKPLLGEGDPKLSSSGKVHLNSRLLASKVEEGDVQVRPGNVYIGQTVPNVKCPVNRLKISVDELVADMAPAWTKDKEFQKLQKDYNKAQSSKASDESKLSLLEEDKKKRSKAILAECMPIAVELSPVCDFAQGKQQVARFIGGILVPVKYQEIFKVSPAARTYMKQLQAISVTSTQEPVHFILNARFFYTLPKPSLLVKTVPSCRLRAPVVADIQAWFSSHAARPGYVVVD